MRLLNLTLSTPAENLALDEALLEGAGEGGETLRFWEPACPMVVIGRSSRAQEEARLEACARLGAPVLRRVSGGAAVVAGPGCLMYAVVLDLARRPELKAIDRAHACVLGRLAAALEPVAPTVRHAGVSDLAIATPTGDLFKCSGNSLRVRRRRVLYHGSLLYDLDLSLVGRLLHEPDRQPEYRARRTHDKFLANLPIDRAELVALVTRAFGAGDETGDYPRGLVDELVREKYSQDEWNLSR